MKMRVICKSKIHHAVVTGADVDYIGSIGIDAGLMRLTDIVEGEQVMAAPASESAGFRARVPERVAAPVALVADAPAVTDSATRTMAASHRRTPNIVSESTPLKRR